MGDAPQGSLKPGPLLVWNIRARENPVPAELVRIPWPLSLPSELVHIEDAQLSVGFGNARPFTHHFCIFVCAKGATVKVVR
jgi:hypothetical protein